MNKNYSAIAQAIYRAYCKQAGGVTFGSKPLPTYAELREERQACWEAAAREAVAQVAAMRDAQPYTRSVDDSVQTSHPNACTTVYQYQPTSAPAPIAPLEQSPIVFSSGGGGDFSGAGASGDFDSSSSSASIPSDSG